MAPDVNDRRFKKKRRIRRTSALAGLGLLGAAVLSACASGGPAAAPTTAPAKSPPASSSTGGSPTSVAPAPETNTPGDIPDTVAYIPYSNAAGGYSFTHPEGWAQTGQGTSVSFSDKYNGVAAGSVAATAPPTATSAASVDVPKLRASEPAFALTSVTDVRLPAGSGVLIIYRRNSPPDPVTGRSVRQEVHRYEIYGNNHSVVLDLFGAVGADNVDPYTKMSQSLRLS
jgi:hypothetical protein